MIFKTCYPGNDATSLTTYTTHTRASGHKNIYIYIYIDSTPWKAIIGMALRAIINYFNIILSFQVNECHHNYQYE